MTQERCSFLSIHLSKYPPICYGSNIGNCAQLGTGDSGPSSVPHLLFFHDYSLIEKTQYLPGSHFKFEMENKNTYPT